MKLESQPGKGTTFRVLLPASKREATAPTSDQQRPPAVMGGATVLIVDDEPSVRNVAAKVLESEGYRVLTASDGVEGVEVFSENLADIKAVILDATMPRMSGEDAMIRMRQLRPDVPIIMCSGYDEQEAVSKFGQDGPAFLKKPFQIDTLLVKVAEAVAQKQ